MCVCTYMYRNGAAGYIYIHGALFQASPMHIGYGILLLNLVLGHETVMRSPSAWGRPCSPCSVLISSVGAQAGHQRRQIVHLWEVWRIWNGETKKNSNNQQITLLDAISFFLIHKKKPWEKVSEMCCIHAEAVFVWPIHSFILCVQRGGNHSRPTFHLFVCFPWDPLDPWSPLGTSEKTCRIFSPC